MGDSEEGGILNGSPRTERRLRNIKVIRPLEIGYERLAGGVSALDFVQYNPIRSVKGLKYKPNEKLTHPIFGDLAILSRDVVGEELKEHSNFYKSVVEGRLGKKVDGVQDKRPTDNHIPWHLVEEPEHALSFSQFKKKRKVMKKEVTGSISDYADVLLEHRTIINGFDKLMNKIDYLRHYNPEDGAVDSEDSDD